MIRKLLIANRGEIACRIIRTCRRLGIATVAVYSDADVDALHVAQADEAVHLGGAAAADSYLNQAAVLRAAQITGADALHPGFGFLAENAAFADAVIAAGLTWIGPSPAAMRAVGDKRQAKLTLRDIPLVPGYTGADQSDAALIDAAHTIGLPVMIKAAAGGGGKGMRRVDDPADVPGALAAARREAQQAFGDGTLILERYVTAPRHVEVQIFGDASGHVIALGERECSIQRRHQKIIEESPSAALDDELRARMCAAAVSIGQQIGYTNAGTVEFILDHERNFYFLEVNTRLQVEHPVTELRSGFDLVEWQLRIAEGVTLAELTGHFPDPLELLSGHAIEARVYAERPAADFLPSIGTILAWETPTADQIADPDLLRVDAGIRAGDAVTVHYDPMIAKVIAWGATRAEAAARLAYALSRITLLGVEHNLGYLRRVLLHRDYLAGNIDTGFIDRHPDLLPEPAAVPVHALIAAALLLDAPSPVPGLPAGNWRSNPYRASRHTFTVNGLKHTIDVSAAGADYTAVLDGTAIRVRVQAAGAHGWHITADGHRLPVIAVRDGGRVWVGLPGQTVILDWDDPLPIGGRRRETAGTLRSPMPGQVIRVAVQPGQEVAKGDILLIIEAMKMEHRIKAPYAGRVAALYYEAGQSVQAGVILLDLQASEPPG